MSWWKKLTSGTPVEDAGPRGEGAGPRAQDPGGSSVALELRSGRPGAVPPDGSPVVAGVQLPAGRPFRNDPVAGGSDVPATVRGWLTDEPVEGAEQLWWQLAERFVETGLWPLLTEGLGGDLDRPWREGELGAPAAPSEVDAETLLRELHQQNCEPDGDDAEREEDEVWPGPAGAVRPESDAVALPKPLGLPSTTALLLVPVTQPADVLATLGWLGAVNCDVEPAALSAVLRSWEQRFGAVPVSLGFDSLTVAVSHPPTDRAEVLRLAHEHYAFCPDNIDQGVGTVSAYAEDLAGQRLWSFWWD